MRVRAFLPETYVTNYLSGSNVFLTNSFNLAGGKVCIFDAPPQPGLTLLHFEFIPNEFTGGTPYATGYCWDVPY